MELGLSLGDAPKFLENKSQKQQKSGIKDFCMALSLNCCAVENQAREETQKSQENDDEISEEDGSHYNLPETPLQLNLLPLAPLPRRISSRPCFSHNGKALDVKRRRGAAEEASSANSASSGNGNPCQRERGSGDDDDENGAHNRKKLRLSKQQSAFLEESFKEHNTLNPKHKLALAKHLNLRPRQVEVWFQNRRARTKLKQTEVDCEYLKRCCDALREENRRLHKELQELRALNTSNPLYMQKPATTLTVCPSCTAAAAAVDLNRSRFHPFARTSNHPNQPAPS